MVTENRAFVTDDRAHFAGVSLARRSIARGDVESAHLLPRIAAPLRLRTSSCPAAGGYRPAPVIGVVAAECVQLTTMRSTTVPE